MDNLLLSCKCSSGQVRWFYFLREIPKDKDCTFLFCKNRDILWCFPAYTLSEGAQRHFRHLLRKNFRWVTFSKGLKMRTKQNHSIKSRKIGKKTYYNHPYLRCDGT